MWLLTQLVFSDAYIWLVLNIVGISGIIMWLGIAVGHDRFRRAYLLQGYRLEDLPYRSPFFPAGPHHRFRHVLGRMAGQNYEAVLHGQISEVASSYIGPAALRRWFELPRRAQNRVVPLAEMDVAPVEIGSRSLDRGDEAGAGGQRGLGALVTWALPAWRCVSGVGTS